MLTPPKTLFFFMATLAACHSSDDKEEGGDSTFEFAYYAYDCATSAPIFDSEFCDLLPEQSGEGCGMSNPAGKATVGWDDPPQEGDILTSWTKAGYSSVLMTGHYRAADYSEWEIMTLQGAPISVNYCFFSESDNAAWMATGDVVEDPAMGQVVYQLTSNSGALLSGAVISLVDDSGQSHGEVRYQHETADELDPSLNATSASGLFLISNVEPGNYTLTISHENLRCGADYSFYTEIDNEVKVPVQAGFMASGSVNCRVGG